MAKLQVKKGTRHCEIDDKQLLLAPLAKDKEENL